MRSALSIILGFAILIGASSYISSEMKRTSHIIQDQLDQVEILIQSDRWEEASQQINQAYKSWSQAKKWFATVLNHSTLNSIEICYQRLYQFSQFKETSLSLAELKTLAILIKDIPESDNLNLINIL